MPYTRVSLVHANNSKKSESSGKTIATIKDSPGYDKQPRKGFLKRLFSKKSPKLEIPKTNREYWITLYDYE